MVVAASRAAVAVVAVVAVDRAALAKPGTSAATGQGIACAGAKECILHDGATEWPYSVDDDFIFLPHMNMTISTAEA